MILEGRIAVQAPAPEVWALLQDMPRVARCLPGCESLVPSGPDAWKATARSKVGPVSVAFQGDLRVRERVPPERMALHFEGRDASTASHVRVRVDLRLEPQAAGTSLAYQADVLLSGRLGQMGQSIVRQTAAVLLDEFVRCIHQDLLRQAAPPWGSSPAPERPASLSLPLRVLARLLQTWVLGAFHRMRTLRRR